MAWYHCHNSLPLNKTHHWFIQVSLTYQSLHPKHSCHNTGVPEARTTIEGQLHSRMAEGELHPHADHLSLQENWMMSWTVP